MRDERCEDCNCIQLGDVVEHKMNTEVFGIVIGFSGSLVLLRLSSSLETESYHDWELRHIEDDEFDEPPAKEGAPSGASNVVRFPGGRLTKDTPTKGAA